MTRYQYRAVDDTGAVRRGMLEASSPAVARAQLRAQRVLPVSLRPAAWPRLQYAWPVGFRRGGINGAEVALFTRQMATLVGSGVQIEAALSAIAAQSSPRLAALCAAVRAAILDGGSLSAALGQKTGRFDRYYLISVRAGEQSGRLGAVLTYLADHAEAAQRHRQTVVLALIYPAILVAVSAAVIVALLVFVLPDIVRVFAARGADLPPLTRVMIALSDGISRYGALLLVTLLVLAAGAAALLRQPAWRRGWHGLLWRVGIARQMVLVQFTGTLATLTQSGVTLSDALAAATASVGNLEARARLGAVSDDVREGAALSRALAAQHGFPPMMITMIASGEASGSLPAMLSRFWVDQVQSLQARTKALVGLVEPLVLLGMGGIVMLLVLAILLPIANLNSLVG